MRFTIWDYAIKNRCSCTAFHPIQSRSAIPYKAGVTELHPSQTPELGQRDRADNERREVRDVGGQQGIRLNVGRFGETGDRFILDAQQVGALCGRKLSLIEIPSTKGRETGAQV